MVRRCAHHRQAGGEVYTLVKSKCLEGNQALIVIHCQDGIKLFILVGTEESVGRERAESQYAFAVGSLHGRGNDLYLFAAKGTAVAGMRV